MKQTQQIELSARSGDAMTSPEGMVRLGENQQMIARVHDFIKSNFIEGVDFGPADPRNPKPVLLKPGAEKVCRLFNLRITWRKDDDTASMIETPNTICYLCELWTPSGEKVGEGRGAETIGNKGRDANKAIKIAEKCALIDAALYTFALSEKYTQDMIVEKRTLDTEKEALRDHVETLRQRTKSDLSTNQWIVAACNAVLKTSTIQTLGALNKLKSAIESGRVDLVNGGLK